MKLSTNNWRQKNASFMLNELSSLVQMLPISAHNDVTFLPEVGCYTYEIRKEWSISGYPNAGKGFSPDEALVSGLMEAIEMCFVEKSAPLDWYSKDLSHYLSTDNIDSSIILSESHIGLQREFNLENIFVTESNKNGLAQTKDLTNGLASGYSFEDALRHSIYELIERHMIGNNIYQAIDLSEISFIDSSFLDSISRNNIKLIIFDKGIFADVYTFSCFLLYTPSDESDQYMGSFGFGSSNNPMIAIARSISESMQLLSLSNACNNQMFGFGSVLTSPLFGYSSSVNNLFTASKVLASQFFKFKSLYDASIDNFDPHSVNKCSNSLPSLEKIFSDLEQEGIQDLQSIEFTNNNLPFHIVRTFSYDLTNKWSI